MQRVCHLQKMAMLRALRFQAQFLHAPYARGEPVTCARHCAPPYLHSRFSVTVEEKEHEIYLVHNRNDEHYLEEGGANTSHWFQRKRRIEKNGVNAASCSTNVQGVMACPASAGKEAGKTRTRQANLLCQSLASQDYGRYVTLRGARASCSAPVAPRRPDASERSQSTQRSTQTTSAGRQDWIHSRDERRGVLATTAETDVRRTVIQLPTTAQFPTKPGADVAGANVTHAVCPARSCASGTSAPKAASTPRAGAVMSTQIAGASMSTPRRSTSARRVGRGARPAERRVAAACVREVTACFNGDRYPCNFTDEFHATHAAHQGGGSSVKYNIIANEQEQFGH